MSIYQVNGYNEAPTFYVPDTTFLVNVAPNNPYIKAVLVGTEQDAQVELVNRQKNVILQETVRFSVCATFVEGDNSVWREVLDSDPEDTVCKVFNAFTGQYISYSTKTEANAANEQMKQQFLATIGMDSVKTLDALPEYKQPATKGTQTL